MRYENEISVQGRGSTDIDKYVSFEEEAEEDNRESWYKFNIVAQKNDPQNDQRNSLQGSTRIREILCKDSTKWF